ncbi:MAG: ABC transporter substrate-binding protein [Alphaproteobacteria bacterium]|nr:ABC transporter substrate-binding protein [Alphaproteobacteria bacterium]
MVQYISAARRGVLLAFVMLVSVVTASATVAGPDAEAFTQRLIDQGVQILRNTADPGRKVKFREFITQYADVRKTARFTLGNYARTAAPADVDTFVEAFKDYAVAIYETQLDKYKGESLKVVGSVDNKPGDYIVKTVVQGGSGSDAMRIDFRMSGGNGAYKFYDISVEGAWLGISQQEQFKSFLEQNRGSVPALTADLKARTQRILTGGK